MIRRAKAFFSKYLTGGYIFPKFEEEEEFIEFIENFLKKHEIDYVIAVWPEKTLITLNKYRDRIEKFSKLLIPPENILDKALDKSKTLRFAKHLNIPIPKTIVINNMKELDDCKDLNFPVVMKPSSRNYKNPLHAKMDFKREYFQNFSSLQRFVDKFKPFRFLPVLVQEYCNGEEIGFPVLMNKGKCVACMQYKILRTYPVNGGVSTYREAVEIDPSLKEHSIRLLEAMGWNGVAELDYITDNKDGKIKLLEVNGRFWGAVALAVQSGIDFPYLLYRCAEGSNEIEVPDYKVGTKSRTLCGDTAWLSDILFRRVSDKELGDRPSKPRAVLEYLKSFHPSVKYDFQSFDDPLPGVLDILSAATSIFSGAPLTFRVNLES